MRGFVVQENEAALSHGEPATARAVVIVQDEQRSMVTAETGEVLLAEQRIGQFLLHEMRETGSGRRETTVKERTA